MYIIITINNFFLQDTVKKDNMKLHIGREKVEKNIMKMVSQHEQNNKI